MADPRFFRHTRKAEWGAAVLVEELDQGKKGVLWFENAGQKTLSLHPRFLEEIGEGDLEPDSQLLTADLTKRLKRQQLLSSFPDSASFLPERTLVVLEGLDDEFTMIDFLSAYRGPFISDRGKHLGESENVREAKRAAEVLRSIGCGEPKSGQRCRDTTGHQTSSSMWSKPPSRST